VSHPPQAETSSTPARGAAWLVGLTLAALVLFALGGEETRLALRYEREAVLSGEWLRLLTGHLVHGSTQHLLLNCAGLLLIAALFPHDYSAGEWLIVGLGSLAAIDLGFVLLEPQLHWYVGFSGVLHGLLAAGAVAWLRRESRLLAWALSAILAGKLIWEQTVGALPLSGDLPVVVDAHLYGAAGGLIVGLILWIRERRWPSEFRPL
jgi:rhomboid family GlyGly-CTERM serine protease